MVPILRIFQTLGGMKICRDAVNKDLSIEGKKIGNPSGAYADWESYRKAGMREREKTILREEN